MKKIIMSVLAVSLFTATGAVAAASPAFVPDETFTEVKTSGVEKAWVGPDQGDATIIIDSEGNQTTEGELRAQFNLNFQEIRPDEIDQLQSLPGNEKNEINPPAILSAYGNAWAYQQENSTLINCYGYATKYPGSLFPGGNADYLYDSRYFTNVNWTANLVLQDSSKNPMYWKSGWRILSSRTASINADEHRIAFRVGWIDKNNNGKPDIGTDLMDYHFMVQNSSGTWSQKQGAKPSVNSRITDPSSHRWDSHDGKYSNFYNSATVYIAARVY